MRKYYICFSIVLLLVLSGSVLAEDFSRSDYLVGEKDLLSTEKNNEFILNNEKSFVEDEVVIVYKDINRDPQLKKIPRGKKSSESIREIMSSSASKEIDTIEPNYIARALSIPNDPLYSCQWNMDNPTGSGINMQKAWDISTGKGVVVAVVDTGVAYEERGGYHQAEDLAGACVVPGYDFIGNDPNANDEDGHGTHVAGTIAQNTNNGIGVAGVAFDACIMPVRVLDRNGFGTYFGIATGVRWAVDHGAKIINMSLGGTAKSSVLEQAVAYAYSKGVTVAAAAGNFNSNTIWYPAGYDKYVIAVSATDYLKNKAYYSSYGSFVDIAAPGGDTATFPHVCAGEGTDGIMQNTFNRHTYPNTGFGYKRFQGTSMATPHVAGVAALLVANGIAITPTTIRKALESTARDIGKPGRDIFFGAGLLDAFAALNWSGNQSAPQPIINSPKRNTLVSNTIIINTSVATSSIPVTTTTLSVDGRDINSSWDTHGVANGRHALTFKVVNSKGLSNSYTTSIFVAN